MRSESAGRTHQSTREERAGAAPPRRLGVRGAGVNKERADRDGPRRDVDAARWAHDLFVDGDERPADSAPATAGDLRAQLSARPAAAARGRAPGPSLHRPRAPSERRVGAASQLSLAQLLCSLNLERFLPLFEAEEMDMAALALCSEEDLRALGVPMGPRKKILALL